MIERSKVSLGAVGEEAFAFCKAEAALIAPLALLGFGLPMVTLLLAIPIDEGQTTTPAPGPWMFWMLPCGLLSILGFIAVSALTLTPGISVRESILVAIQRVPAALGLLLLYIGVQVVLSLPLMAAGLLEGRPGPISTLVYFIDIAVVLWLLVRVTPIWAVVAQRPVLPWAAAIRAFRLTGSHFGKLLLLGVTAGFAMALITAVLLIPIAAITGLIGLVAGSPNVGLVVAKIAFGMIVSAIAGVWTVYVAVLYRRLDGASSGI